MKQQMTIALFFQGLGLGRHVLLILALASIFSGCGRTDGLEGVWVFNNGPYRRQLVQFDQKHCRITPWHMATGLTEGEQIKIPYTYDREKGRISFHQEHHTITCDIVVYDQDPDRYFRLLYPKNSNNDEQKITFAMDDSRTFLDQLATASENLPQVFRQVPDWVGFPPKISSSKSKHPLHGLWQHRLGRGEDNCLMEITMTGKTKGLIRFLGRHPVFEKQQEPVKIHIDAKSTPFKMRGDDAEWSAVFRFADQNLLQIVWDEQAFPAHIGDGSLWVRRATDCTELLHAADAISQKWGIDIHLERPDYFERFGTYHLMGLEDTQCAAGLALLAAIEKELERYPQTLIERYLDEVALAGMVAVNDEERAGMVQIYGGRRLMFLSANASDPALMFHHYLFQLMEVQSDDPSRFVRDVDWRRASGLRADDPADTDAEASGPCMPEPGFVSPLAATGFGNDRSQVFAALMTQGGPCAAPADLTRDPVLVDKIYLLYYEYKESLEPVINQWITKYNLPDHRNKPRPQAPPPMPEPVARVSEPKPETPPQQQTVTPPSNQIQNRSTSPKTAPGKPDPEENAPVVIARESSGSKERTSRDISKPKAEPKNGKAQVFLTVRSAMGRRNWKTVTYALGDERETLEYNKDDTLLASLSLAPGTYNFSITGNKYAASPLVPVEIKPGKTAMVECIVDGARGRKITITVDGQTIIADQKLQ